MYVAVKGGERAIANAHRLLAEERRGDPSVPELSLDQIDQQLALAVDRVMIEGSLYDRELAALAIKQARGDLPGARVPDDLAAVRRDPAARHGRDDDPAARVGDVQGRPGRPDSRRDVRLHPPAPRFRSGPRAGRSRDAA